MSGRDMPTEMLEWLTAWALWMHRRDADLGCPSKACGMGDALTNYCTAEDDSEAYWEKHRVPFVIGVIDACIDSLPPLERHAIWYKFGIRRDRPEQFEMVYVPALYSLESLVIRRIAI